MGALRMYARSVLRRKVLGTVAVALLVGVAGGAVLTAFAGARRTESAYPRLLDELHSADVVMFPRQFRAFDTRKISALPNVTVVGKADGFGLASRKADGSPDSDFGAGAGASTDGIALYEIERSRILEGRIPAAARVDEILVNQTAARALHLHVGSAYKASLFNLNELNNAPEIANPTPAQWARYFTPVDLRVVGIGRNADELLSNENQDQALIMLTPAFARRYPAKISYAFAGVELRHGQRDVPAFEAALRDALPNVQYQLTTRATRVQTFGSAVRPYVDSLRLFAAVAAIAGLFVVAQALTRLVGSDGGDGPTLDALGATRAQRAAASLARAVIAAALGAALAVVMAIALSPLLPIGPARAAEPHPGIRIDTPVVVGGFFAIAIVLLLPAAWIAWRRAGSAQMAAASDQHWRPARGIERLAAAGAAASAVVGMRFALQRDRRPGAAPVGATLLGMIIAVATVAAALTFGATLDRLVTTPHEYGWNWNAMIDTYDNGTTPDLVRKVSADRDLTAVTLGRRGNVVIDGRTLTAFGFDRIRGTALPLAIAGRFPTRSGEVALGAKTMRDLGKSVGDRVPAVTADGAATTLLIVGRTVLPSLSLNGTFGLGEGVALTQDGILRLDHGADPSFFLVDIRPGVSISTLNTRYGDVASVLGPQKPGDIRAYERVRSTPTLLAAVLVLLGVGVLAHLLITQVRSRRRDLAILKTIGFSRRQVAGSVAWQATTVTAITLAIALPRVWRSVAGAGAASPATSVSPRPWSCPLPPFCSSSRPASWSRSVGGAARSDRIPNRAGHRSTIGVTVTTSIDPAKTAASPEPLALTSLRDDVRERPARSMRTLQVAAVGVLATGLAIAGALEASDVALGPGRVLACVLVAAWSASALFVATHRPQESLSWILVGGALAGGAGTLADAFANEPSSSASTKDLTGVVVALAVSLLVAIGLHLALALPSGVLGNRARRGIVIAGYAGALGLAAYLYTQRPEVPLGPLAVAAAIAGAIGLVGYVRRCRRAPTAQARARLQWTAWGVVVAAAIALGAVVLNTLLSWPEPIAAIAISATLLVPFALALSASDQLAVRIDRLLVHSITLTGLVGLVGASYLLIVLGLGRAPTGSEKTLLGLSMLAAAVAALLWVPARERLADLATRRVYGEGHAPDEVLRTFGSRLTRALPLDELLLQLAESLKATMNLEVAEVWTKGAGRLERAVSVPDRGPAVIPLGPEEETVVAHAGVSGPGWAQVWLPAVLVGLEEPVLRTAPVTNSGELLGLIVVRRFQGALPFNEADDLALTELARQVGLALHNVKLDSALQESLDAVRRQADELRASRARIVEATDTERRRIERDLHDGAQQHLVALAVGVRLARQFADTDPEQAKSMLEQIGLDLQDAVQELRNLADGIYPPLLMDRGLPDALRVAAGRAALPTSVEPENVGRYPQQVEAAVYFCCLEALQNAGKHAGEDSSAVVTVREVEGALLFEVTDDGAGFDLSSGAQRGHGFVNMSDRVGAFGGSVTVDSAPGQGTKISGRIPLGD